MHRENLISLFRRKGYKNVPVQFDLCPSLIDAFRKKTGSRLSFQEFFNFPMREIAFPDPPEQKKVNWKRYYPEDLHTETVFDAWGIAREPGSKAAAHMTRMRHPMASLTTLEEFKKYPFPDFSSVSIDSLAAEIKSIHDQDLAAYGFMESTIWEISWYLRDMTLLMIDLMAGEKKADWLLDKVTDLACIRASMFAQAGVDILKIGDDLGMQTTLLMSTQNYRKFLKSRHEKVIRKARQYNPSIIIHYHSCGYITPLIEDLIDIGVDVLNPVQPECMDFKEIHSRFGHILSFSGTLGTQTTMPFGSPEDIRKIVHQNLSIAGSQGGLLCCPTHILEPEVPWENIMAYLDACRSYI